MNPADGGASSRETVLGRVRHALRDVPARETPGDVPVPRDYLTSTDDDREAVLDRFAERVAEYKAEVHRVSAADLPGAIAAACAARGLTRVIAPADLPDAWVPGEITVVRDEGLSLERIEASHAVLTGCALGVSQTGTIALDAGPAQGRRLLSLLPDCHLCVVREDQVVGLVPEGVAKLHDSARAPGRPITLVSGPSATSDIELSRVEGVHGPRSLVVFLVR